LYPVCIKTADKRCLCKVVMRNRKREGPFKCTSVAPRVASDFFILRNSDDDVDQQDDDSDRHHDCPHRGYHVRGVIPLPIQVSEHAARHTPKTEEVLDQECHMETCNEQHESNLAELLAEHGAEHQRPVVVQTCKQCKNYTAHDNVVEVRYDEVRVMVLVVGRRSCLHDTCDPAHDE